MRMKRECIFFQWGRTELKSDYAYVIMLDAIRTGKIRMHLGPHFLRENEWSRKHQDACDKNINILTRLFAHLYIWGEHLNRRKKYIFLFNEWHPALQNSYFLSWIKKKYDVKLVLVLRNMIKNKKHPGVCGKSIEQLKKEFDLIVTDEELDAQLYGFLFLPDPFSTITEKKAKIKYDLCFIGGDKGRAELVSEIAKQAQKENVTYNIKIVDNERKKDNLQHTSYLPYTDIIKQDMQANCILEILQPGQNSCTLRLQEAVCLGKKLLTNNQGVKEERYYVPKYVQVFDSVNEIDWNFVKERMTVDYSYQGEYSPVAFIRRIEKELEEEKK